MSLICMEIHGEKPKTSECARSGVKLTNHEVNTVINLLPIICHGLIMQEKLRWNKNFDKNKLYTIVFYHELIQLG